MGETLQGLMRELYERGRECRTVGVTLAGLAPFTPRQLSLSDIREERIEHDERLSLTLSRLKGRYGNSIIHQGYVAPVKQEEIEVMMEVG